MSLQGKIALITGASRGIGLAILSSLAKEGLTVIGTATTESGAEKISAFIKENNWNGCGKRLLVNEKESIDAVIKEINQEFGAISVLVNNAGITEDGLLMRMKDEQWENVINTNLTSVFSLSKALLRDMMKERFGRIINISSVVAAMGNIGQTNYAASKAGMIGFSKALAREVASRGITVNSIAPGFIQTDMTDKLPEEQKALLLQQVPLGILGQAEDIAEAVVFLAKSKYITGETLHINGGMYMV